MSTQPQPGLVLASTSSYRRELLARLGIPFTVAKPNVDETPHINEPPAKTAERLAIAKAKAVLAEHPNALIIGSDQVAACGNERFGKPGNAERAIAQLQRMSGQVIVFHTALCVLDSASGAYEVVTVPTEVGFRTLSDAEIMRYVAIEEPFDCAGSAKAEALGISLLDYLRGDDPNALIGLPLIALCRMLRTFGLSIP